MKKVIVLIAAAFAANTASAQLTVSPEVGFQMVNVNVKDSSNSGLEPKAKASYRVGANLGFGLTKNISLTAGAFYSAQGFKVEAAGFSINETANYLQIPVFVNYMFGKVDGNRFFVGAGPYWGYCLGGKVKTKGSFLGTTINDESKLEVGNDEDNDNIKSMDFGVNANIGFMTSMGIYARAHYAIGLANTAPGGNSDNSIKNMSYGISIGYQIKL